MRYAPGGALFTACGQYAHVALPPFIGWFGHPKQQSGIEYDI